MAGSIVTAFRDVYRENDGDRPHKPVLSEIRSIGSLIQNAVDMVAMAVSVGDAALYATKAGAQNDLPNRPAGSLLIVYADDSPANNGIYVKQSGNLVDTKLTFAAEAFEQLNQLENRVDDQVDEIASLNTRVLTQKNRLDTAQDDIATQTGRIDGVESDLEAFTFDPDKQKVGVNQVLEIPAPADPETRFVGLLGEDGTVYPIAFDMRTGAARLLLDQTSVNSLTRDTQLRIEPAPESRWVGFLGEDGTRLPGAFNMLTGETRFRLDRVSADSAFSIVSGREQALYGGERLTSIRRVLRSIKAGRGGKAKIDVFGDSWSSFRHWVSDVSAELSAEFGYAGHGWLQAGLASDANTVRVVSADYTITYTGTWAPVDTTTSPSQEIYRSATVGDKATFVSKADERTVSVWASAGGFRYRFNGGGWTNVGVPAGGALRQFVLAGVPASSAAGWTLEIETVAAPFDFAALYLEGGSGVMINRFARAGTSTKEVSALDLASLRSVNAAIGAQLKILTHLTNEQTLGGVINVTPDQHYANCIDWIARMRLDTPAAAILLASSPRVRNDGYSQAIYSAAMRQAAADAGVAHLDFQSLFGVWPNYAYGGPAPLMDASLIHTDQNGDDVLVDGYVRAILGTLS